MGNRAKLTVRLPKVNLENLKRYAAEHGLTVTDVVNRLLTRLREIGSGREVHPEVERLSGLVPSGVDARTLFHEHLLEKFR